jgi:AcrR family transcriptional regulator
LTNQDFTRRASYGPSSPGIGTRGAKTRQQIVEAALERFSTQGFHGTAVEEIAATASVSRATLYQYFDGKDSIFIELMHEAGGALNRVTRELGPFGPSAVGYGNLHRWLAEWTQVFDRYATVFVEWVNVNSSQAPLHPKLVEFVDFHTERSVAALKEAGRDDTTMSADSILALALFNRFNYIRHVYRPGLTQAELMNSLAIAIQKFLFPTTPDSVLATRQSDDATERPGERAPIPDIGPLAELPDRSSIIKPTPFAGLSPQATETVRQLLNAAGRVFAANGYDATNIDQIVGEAGLARGTFYRYFSNKVELITALAWEAASEMTPLFAEFEAFTNGCEHDDLAAWLNRFLRIQRRYSGVLRSWTEGFPIDPQLLAPCADVIAAMGKAIAATFGLARPYPLERRAAGMLFSGLLEHFPNEGTGSLYEPNDAEIVGAQARFIERVLLSTTQKEVC